MAAVHTQSVVSQLEGHGRPIPEVVTRVQRSGAKMIDISGKVPTPLDARLDARSGKGAAAHLRAIGKDIEAATFTNNADRAAVAHMLFGLEWTLLVAIEEVLGRRGGSAALTEVKRSGRHLRGRLRATRRGVPLGCWPGFVRPGCAVLGVMASCWEARRREGWGAGRRNR